ncbi:ethanolamine ammonia-lyase heavy chain [Cupriavidus gilardii J11]|uniref:Ethanolamine ammonia-lyase heavy chain n=1 Tax=Cupriavidus gilardii J11 TaxID=936133 RepID=A0A562BB11_9BURK|nr:ethanolamine ammonia-lyase heavy chain [Cupriavidus gilardii J11]
MAFAHTVASRRHVFADLKTLLAKASPARSGDQLAGIAAASEEERMAARMALADLPLRHFLDEALVPYEADEVTRLIVDGHDAAAFADITSLTVGEFRNWLLLHETDGEVLARAAPGITPEMAAAVSKLMRNQDLIAVARKRRVVTRFRNTIGLPGRLSVRLSASTPPGTISAPPSASTPPGTISAPSSRCCSCWMTCACVTTCPPSRAC